MKNYSKILSDDKFWDWMHNSKPEKGHRAIKNNVSYMEELSGMMVPTAYLVYLPHNSKNNAQTMTMLSKRIPRKYFLELQYCMTIYAKIFGTLFPEMLENISDLAYIEWLLYVEPDNEKYRDHMIHMFKVAYICSHLISIPGMLKKITLNQFSSKHFQEWCKSQGIIVSNWSSSYQGKIMEVALYIASIFHDIGYGHYYLNEYRQRLSRVCRWILPESDPSQKDHRDTKILLKSLTSFFINKEHPLCKPGEKNNKVIISGFIRDCLQLNHSVASSLFVIDLAEQLFTKGALKTELYLAFHIAAEAIMLHDMTKSEKWSHLQIRENGHFLCFENHKDVPLAPILILADELASWKRPRLIPELEGESCIKMSLGGPEHEHEIKLQFIRDKNPSIKIYLNDSGLVSDICDLKCFYSENKTNTEMKLLNMNLQIIKERLRNKNTR